MKRNINWLFILFFAISNFAIAKADSNKFPEYKNCKTQKAVGEKDNDWGHGYEK